MFDSNCDSLRKKDFIFLMINSSKRIKLLRIIFQLCPRVLNSMTTYDIEPRANSLGMVLYNLLVHIDQATNDKQAFFVSKTNESPYSFSFWQILYSFLQRSEDIKKSQSVHQLLNLIISRINDAKYQLMATFRVYIQISYYCNRPGVGLCRFINLLDLEVPEPRCNVFIIHQGPPGQQHIHQPISYYKAATIDGFLSKSSYFLIIINTIQKYQAYQNNLQQKINVKNIKENMGSVENREKVFTSA
ncbi:hypothetical protein BpHYR1_016691 [Brachionus plicatilis]|uniref:Uncharacterized protein n=1 Tax=Brachionus plicatilis TaxID=10195 RepID=A0A3M7RHA5_BRAPC|nr:hypothetical protein BpHYR1_016691 [Brachionus plicatilis]